MNVISKANLFYAAADIGNSQIIERVARWYELATKNNFANLVELQRIFPSADLVKDKLVFNLGSYRLICGVSFLRRTLFFKAMLSHKEYDKGAWK